MFTKFIEDRIKTISQQVNSHLENELNVKFATQAQILDNKMEAVLNKVVLKVQEMNQKKETPVLTLKESDFSFTPEEKRYMARLHEDQMLVGILKKLSIGVIQASLQVHTTDALIKRDAYLESYEHLNTMNKGMHELITAEKNDPITGEKTQ